MLAFKSVKLAVLGGLAFIGGMVALGGSANALAVPACVQPDTCLTFGDFDVYSLSFLNFQTGTSDYFVSATPGNIKDLTVIGTGSNGVPVNTNTAGIDDAYAMPSGNTITYVSTGSQGDTAGDFAGDGATTWDARVSSITDFLGGGGMQIFFGFNEGDQNTAGLPDQDLLLWGIISLYDDEGVNSPLSLVFDGANANPLIQAQTLYNYTDPDGDTLDYAHVHGEICVDQTLLSLIHLGECTGGEAGDPATIDQDLGINQAAFMARSSLLDQALYSGLYDYMQIEFRLAEISSGYEQIFINAGDRFDVPNEVPEPAALALFGFGLAGLGALRRKRR